MPEERLPLAELLAKAGDSDFLRSETKTEAAVQLVMETDADGLIGAGSAGFVVQTRRWVVERSLGWLGRWRRLPKDYEALPEVSEAMITPAMIRLMLHRLAHPSRRRLPAA